MGEAALAPTALYVARPTLRFEGQEDAGANAALQSMQMREAEGGLSSLELGFVNWGSRPDGGAGPLFEDERLMTFGTRLTVYAGQADSPTEIFKGRISAIEYGYDADGPPRLFVHAEDALQQARLERRSEVHASRSIADIASAIAQRCGLNSDIRGLTDRAVVEVQLNETDLGFLRRLLARHDADMQVVGDKLIVGKRADLSRGTVELQLASQLLRLRIVADLAAQVTELKVTGFDPSAGEAIEGKGGGATLGPGSGRTGAEVHDRAFGERAEQIGHRLALTTGEARQLAEAEFAQRARSFVTVEAEAIGSPAIRVGCDIRLRGASPRWNNDYRVSEVTHRYDLQDGYRTDFAASSAYLGAAG